MRFEIIKPIGSGATGVVYLARDTVKGNIVALKQLRPDVAFPQQEVLLAQKVTHPNVCRVHEFFVENGVAQISMEYVEGENLRSVIDRYRAEAASAAVPFDEALGILRQVMDGLEEAHRQGVMHRDLKPENILCRPPKILPSVPPESFQKTRYTTSRNPLNGAARPADSGNSDSRSYWLQPRCRA